ncbi:hypothetical protein HELRODRAFT_175209 [Helobdella robusta]|uniref:Uncharacterized protein n=1 Tax=Helobdella robusta TaxID=6412 RepID=T1F905_HELRO|nr:hypothetical protein HELRODRAFT_175209 [Helobdella robusta]ESO01181.1 hypothetical protein HELRODRAFT_175209 [Helobdella robusta]
MELYNWKRPTSVLTLKIFFNGKLPLEAKNTKQFNWCSNIGTVRVNRLPGLSAKTDNDMKKAGRGSMAQYTTVVDGLCKARKGPNRKRTPGRPSIESQLQFATKKARHRQSVPVADVRTDDTIHWPFWTVERLRCRLPGCNGQSRVSCEKYKISLCFTKDKNCFSRGLNNSQKIEKQSYFSTMKDAT